MRRALWLVGLLLLAAACTREPGISPGDGNSDPAGASRNPVMSMERLQELALELPDDFSDGLSTRSARRMIREVVPVYITTKFQSHFKAQNALHERAGHEGSPDPDEPDEESAAS